MMKTAKRARRETASPATLSPATADEPTLWAALAPHASAALSFWNGFLDLRVAGGAKPSSRQVADLLRLVRAISWVESRHGTGTGHQPGRDPMQCGNPDDAWWPQLAGASGQGDRFVGGPDAKNYWAKDLPAAAAATAGFPAKAKLATLASVGSGHRDPAFNASMSFHWAVPHLIWKMNVPKGRDAAQCDTLTHDQMLDGAKAYNGGGVADHRAQVEAALDAIGESAIDVIAARANMDGAPAALNDHAAQVVDEVLRSIEARCGEGRLFPRGVTRIDLRFGQSASDGMSLTIEAPDPGTPSST